MRKIRAGVVAVILALFALAGVPNANAQGGQSNLTNVVGVRNSTLYNQWGGEIISGNTATGAQTITVCANAVLPDGRAFNPFSGASGTFPTITFDPQGGSGVTESLVITASSQLNPAPSNAPNNQACYNVTATFANLHGSSLSTSQVISGDAGIEEAINDAALNGGGLVYFQADCGNVTLNTGGVTTTTSNCNVPLRFLTAGASVHVTTAVTTSASYSIGTTTLTTAWMTSCTALTLNSTCLAFTAAPAEIAGASYALTPVLITANAAAGAGALHVRVYGYSQVQSAF